jgi:ABC-type multidrug transport system ATPase subunit
MTTSPAVEVTHLHKAYGQTVAVDDVSLTVGAGEIFGVLGPNGAGKTTTVECVIGLRHPDRGSARVLGLDPARHTAQLRQIAGVLEDLVMNTFRVAREVREVREALLSTPGLDVRKLT